MTIRRAGTVVVAFAVLTAIVTWPLVRHFSDSVPSDLGDPLLNAWILGWDADRIRHGLKGLWDAPIFYPYRLTLAYSEHLLGIAVFVAPLVWATGNPLVAYNAAFFLSFVIAGFGMFLLARELTGRDEAGWVAGLIFAFMPARFGHLAHLQVLMSGWMPLALWSLHRFGSTLSKSSLAAFALFFVVQGLSNSYFIYFLGLAALIVSTDLVLRASPDRRVRIIAGLATAGAAVVVALAPIASVYLAARRRYGFERTLDDVTSFGADAAAYFHGNEAVREPLTLWRHLPFVDKPAGSEGELFAGALALVLAAIGFVIACRRSSRADRPIRAYPIMLVIALLLSLGAQPTAWGLALPLGAVYRAAFAVVPGFDGLRVPARLSVLVDLSIAVLAGVALAQSLNRLRSRWWRWALVSVCSAIVVLEGDAAPIPVAFLAPHGRPDRALTTWLRDHAAGPMLELPTGEYAPPRQSFKYEYETLQHGQPIVNGSSGYMSALHTFLGSLASPFLEPEQLEQGLKLLRAAGVRTVVVHPAEYLDREVSAGLVAGLRASPQVVEVTSLGAAEIFRLGPFHDEESPEHDVERAGRTTIEPAVREIPPSSFTATANRSTDRLQLAFDGDIDTRWLTAARQDGSETIDLVFDRPYDVARLRFRVNSRSLGDHPRYLVVDALDEGRGETMLYEGPVIVQLGLGLIRDPLRWPMDVWLRPNRTRHLQLRQTGTTRRWFWSIDELSVWEGLVNPGGSHPGDRR